MCVTGPGLALGPQPHPDATGESHKWHLFPVRQQLPYNLTAFCQLLYASENSGQLITAGSRELNRGAANPGSFAQPCLPSNGSPVMQISITSPHRPSAPALTHGHGTAHGRAGTPQHNRRSVTRGKLFHGFRRRKKKAWEYFCSWCRFQSSVVFRKLWKRGKH